MIKGQQPTFSEDLPLRGSSEPIWKGPVYLTSLIGREKEVQAISQYFQYQEARLVTILGPGGVGKTRVAVQVAQTLRTVLASSIYFVSLASLHNSASVLGSIAQVLELQEKGDFPLDEQLKTFFAAKECVLILDNFEHVASAAIDIEQLLLACPGLFILTTSRTVLRLAGEVNYPLAPLPVPSLEAARDRETLARNPSVALFLRQARMILPGFELTPQNAEPIAEICRRLDGLPLTIELAAARIKLLSPQAMMRDLPQHLEILASKISSYPRRQQTLLNTLTWSYQLLNKQEQSFFRLCSIFANGCTIQAIEGIASRAPIPFHDTLNLLESLLDNCLLTRVTDQDGETRLFMLETIRAYGLSCLQECAEQEIARAAHASYYLSLAQEGEQRLKGPQQSTWLRQLERERENIDLALDWLYEQQEGQLVLGLCRSLSRFWFLRGYWKVGQARMQAALHLPTSQAIRAQVLLNLGEFAFYRHDVELAHTSLEECLALCTSQQMHGERTRALCLLSMLLQKQGEKARAAQLLEECDTLCQATPLPWEYAHVLRARGLTAWTQGEIDQAERYTQEALSLARQTQDQALIAKVLTLLSAIVLRQGQAMQAVLLNQEILRIAEQLEDTYLLATTYQNLGYLKAQARNFTDALPLTQRGLALFRELGYKLLLTNALHTLGYITLHQGDMDTAHASFYEGLMLACTLRDDTLIGWHVLGFAILACKREDYRRSACLLGIVEHYMDTEKVMNATERAELHQITESLCQHLGREEFFAQKKAGHQHTAEAALTTLDTIHQTYPQATEHTKQAPSTTTPYQLTRRELEILGLIAQGLTNAQIASRLVISARTVNWYLTNIYGKLQVSSRSAATRLVLEHKLL